MSNTYLVRDRRPLFYTDPSSPRAHREGNLWASPGSYLIVYHPFLEAIIKTQRHKVRLIAEGVVLPADAIVVRDVENPFIKAQMKKYDAIIAKRKPDSAVAAAAKVAVDEATETPSGETPELVLDPPKKDAPKPEPELEEIKPTRESGGELKRLKSERGGK